MQKLVTATTDIQKRRFPWLCILCRRALECDPLNFAIGSHQAWVKFEEARFPEAIQAAEVTLRLGTWHGSTSWYQMRAYEESGQLAEAIRVRRRMGWATTALEAALHRGGAAGYWSTLKENNLQSRRVSPTRPISIAWTYAHLGDRKRALDWIEQAVEERDSWAVYLNVEPPFAWLRSDPRFQKLKKAAGIP